MWILSILEVVWIVVVYAYYHDFPRFVSAGKPSSYCILVWKVEKPLIYDVQPSLALLHPCCCGRVFELSRTFSFKGTCLCRVFRIIGSYNGATRSHHHMSKTSGWEKDSGHSLAVKKEVSGGEGVRYVFESGSRRGQ